MNETLRLMIEDQINKELWSAYLYLDVAEYYKSKGLDGLHYWFEQQAKEEVEHAEKFMEFLQDNDASFHLKPIEAPNNNFKDLRDPLLFQIEHEKLVTSLITKIYEKASDLHEVGVKTFLTWFINEQLEEEKHSKELLQKFDILATTGLGLYEFDKELKNRQ